MNLKQNHNWLKLLAIVLVLGALGQFPYAYYQLMNWVVVGAAGITAWQAKKQNKLIPFWVFILVAVVFNPLAPLHLRQDIWQIADLIVAGLFAISLFRSRAPRIK